MLVSLRTASVAHDAVRPSPHPTETLVFAILVNQRLFPVS